MKVRLSGQARAYIRDEAAYLRRQSPHAAQMFRNRMSEARHNLATFPEIGRDVQRLPIDGSRRLVVGNYVLDYDIADGEVVIQSIRHGQQIEMDPDMDYEADYEEPVEDSPGIRRR